MTLSLLFEGIYIILVPRGMQEVSRAITCHLICRITSFTNELYSKCLGHYSNSNFIRSKGEKVRYPIKSKNTNKAEIF